MMENELKKLLKTLDETGMKIEITGCGCCGSPNITIDGKLESYFNVFYCETHKQHYCEIDVGDEEKRIGCDCKR
jgi:GH35 family endo-1,4-beta-xylanase